MEPCVLLVEGVPGVGKTTLLREVQRLRVASGLGARSALHLSQAHTYGPLVPGEDAGTLTVVENVAHLDAVLGLVEAFVARGRGRHPAFVSLDTLHLTHCVRPGVVSWHDVREIESRLEALSARLVFLRARPETLWRRAVLERREAGFLRDYATRRFGDTLEAVHEHFVREQERMLAVVARSRLTQLVLDAELAPAGVAACAYRFWTGDGADAQEQLGRRTQSSSRAHELFDDEGPGARPVEEPRLGASPNRSARRGRGRGVTRPRARGPWARRTRECDRGRECRSGYSVSR